MPDPLGEYSQRAAARQHQLERLRVLDARIANARLAIVAAAIVVFVASFRFHLVSPWWLTAPAALFIAVAVWHDRVLRAKRAAGVALAFYNQRIARLEDRWMGTGNSGDRYVDEHH